MEWGGCWSHNLVNLIRVQQYIETTNNYSAWHGLQYDVWSATYISNWPRSENMTDIAKPSMKTCRYNGHNPPAPHRAKLASADDVAQSKHNFVWHHEIELTVSAIGVSLSKRWPAKISKLGERNSERWRTLEDVYIVKLKAFETMLDGLKDVLKG
jgi:hypothetical protein